MSVRMKRNPGKTTEAVPAHQPPCQTRAPMPQLSLRLAKVSDAAELTRLFIATRTECFTFFEISYPFEFLKSLFEIKWIPGDGLWVAEVEGKIAGYMRLESTEFDALYVLPRWHGQGVGTALLDLAKSKSPGELWLWVFQKNLQARRFYERHGFHLDHETDGQENMEKEPDARYVWRSHNTEK